MSDYNGVDIQKIAMLGSFPPLRALSSYCMELAFVLAESKKIQFISFKSIYPSMFYPGGSLRDDDTFPMISHPNLNIRRRLTWYNPVTWITEGLFTEGDVLHAQWWSHPLFFVYYTVCLGFRLRRKPVVFTVHNVFQHERHPVYYMLSYLLFKLGHYFIVHSESNRRQLKRYFGIPDEKISIIPHGVLHFSIQGEMNREKIRDHFGYHPEEKVILLFGAIRPYKGVKTALKAFHRVLKKIPDARMLIAGKPWEEWRPYDLLIERLGIRNYIKTYLRYIPYKEVYKFFLTSDLVILPYHYFDSQSGVGAAALFFRKPMIVADSGGLSELVGDRYIVPPEDPEALANKIIYCLSDLSRLDKMSSEAEKRSESMTWQHVAQQTLLLYDRVSELKRKLRSGG